MKTKFTRYIAVLFLPLLLASCNVIAGPPGSEYNLSSCDTAQTFPYDGYLEGQPTVDLRLTGGVYVWRNGNNWHMRVAKKWVRPQFAMPQDPVVSGRIAIDRGIVFNPRKVDVSPLNDARFSQEEIAFRFDFREGLGREVEGVDFTVKPLGGDYCITLDIRLNGAPQPGIVYFGRFARTPENMPLTVKIRAF